MILKTNKIIIGVKRHPKTIANVSGPFSARKNETIISTNAMRGIPITIPIKNNEKILSARVQRFGL
jgi:hypothetical protein